MNRQRSTTQRTTAAAYLAVFGLLLAFGAATAARADDPPKKGDGKIKFVVGQVTKTPDKSKAPDKNKTPDKSKAPDPNKAKQPPKSN